MRFKQFLEHAPQEFWDFANEQRGAPERAMLTAARLMQGGVMASAIEHVGDLTHRMAERPTFGSAGYGYVKEKVDKCLMWLTNGYGFYKEFQENLESAARYSKEDPQVFKQKVYAALKAYADEHRKLRPQPSSEDCPVSGHFSWRFANQKSNSIFAYA